MSDSKLSKLESITRITATVAVPVVIAIFGWLIQSGISNMGIKRDYVQIAVNILSTPKNDENAAMHRWAARLLNENSPTKLHDKELASLENGLVPASKIKIDPPTSLMQPPKLYKDIPESTSLQAASSIIIENNAAAVDNARHLKQLQEWVRKLTLKVNGK